MLFLKVVLVICFSIQERVESANRKAARARQTLSSLLMTADESLKISNLSRHGRDRY